MVLVWSTHTHTHTQDIFLGHRTLPAHTAPRMPLGTEKEVTGHRSCEVDFLLPGTRRPRERCVHPGLLGCPAGKLPSEITSPGSDRAAPTEGTLFRAFCLFIVSTGANHVYRVAAGQALGRTKDMPWLPFLSPGEGPSLCVFIPSSLTLQTLPA